jgi:hypothetical protein
MCSKLYIVSSRIFADFYSFSIYFPVLRFDFRVYLKSENPFPWGPAVSINAGRCRCLIGGAGRWSAVTASGYKVGIKFGAGVHHVAPTAGFATRGRVIHRMRRGLRLNLCNVAARSWCLVEDSGKAGPSNRIEPMRSHAIEHQDSWTTLPIILLLNIYSLASVLIALIFKPSQAQLYGG